MWRPDVFGMAHWKGSPPGLPVCSSASSCSPSKARRSVIVPEANERVRWLKVPSKS